MRRTLFAFCVLASAIASAASAQTVEPFYKGKTIHLVLSTGVGGGYATYGRTLARHMSDHLAGNPNIIVESMPGAGGIRAANWLYFTAPKDGTTIGIIHSVAPLAPLFGTKGAQFDATKITWLGSMDHSIGMCISWHDSPIQTWSDMLSKEFIVGSSGIGSSMDVYPAILNMLLGTKMRVVSGYEDGSSIYLAMQRGELEGRCGGLLTAIKTTLPDWITEKKFVVPIIVAPERHPEYPEVPTVMEFVKDEQARQVFDLLFATQQMDRPVLAPPSLPPERVSDLRNAFVATMQDPAFRQDAEHQKLTIDYISGEKLAATIDHVYSLPASVVALAKKAMGNGASGSD